MNDLTKQSKSGFALVEVLVAMVILAFGALALVQLMALGIKINVQTLDDSQATTLAQWKVETLAGLGYQNLTPGGSLDSDEPGYFEDFSEPDKGVVYKKRWTIAPCAHPDATHTNLTDACDATEHFVQTPWYEITVRVFSNRIDEVANTQARQVTIKTQVIQPF